MKEPAVKHSSGSGKHLMLIWTGAVVPSYRHFFDELSKYARLTVLSPKVWKHGSKISAFKPAHTHYNLACTWFFPNQKSFYVIPLLPFFLWRYRPSHIYVMDELDRISTFIHCMLIRLLLRKAILVTYSLQNIVHPSYYRFYHLIAMRLNFKLVHQVIAATRESGQVLASHGYRSKQEIIPLGVSQSFFFPGDKQKLRHKFEIGLQKTVIAYAGSLSPEKGIGLVAQQLGNFPHLYLLTAGEGILKNKIEDIDNPHIRQFGTLEGEKLREIYQLSDYVILPSITTGHWKEQIGRSLIEGILCGCVALGSSSGNIPHITCAPEATFKENNLGSLYTLLEQLPLINHEDIYQKQLKQVRTNYLWEKVAEKTIQYILPMSK